MIILILIRKIGTFNLLSRMMMIVCQCNGFFFSFNFCFYSNVEKVTRSIGFVLFRWCWMYFGSGFLYGKYLCNSIEVANFVDGNILLIFLALKLLISLCER
jgi:hypothetical protein